MSRDDEVGQHVNSKNIPEQKLPKTEIMFVRGNDGMGSDMHTRNK